MSLSTTNATPVSKLHRRHVASLSLLFALSLSCLNIFFDESQEAEPAGVENQQRSLQEADAHVDPAPRFHRRLAKHDVAPPADDEIANQFVVKAWVGYAQVDVWEEEPPAVLLKEATASTTRIGIPYGALFDNGRSWGTTFHHNRPEWFTIDLGIGQDVHSLDIEWNEAYAEDLDIQVSFDGAFDGVEGVDWETAQEVRGNTMEGVSGETTHHPIGEMTPHASRYIRIYMTKRRPGFRNFSFNQVIVRRNKRIEGSAPTGTFCGATTEDVKNRLFAAHGGSLLQVYENAGAFLAGLTAAQQDAMSEDSCTFTVEPNYVVRARGKSSTLRGRQAPDAQSLGDSQNEEEQRRLAIPEFNLVDADPANWGLERMSSRGKKNGKYIWFHEGTGTHIYMFDTGVYPDHSDWGHYDNSTSRLSGTTLCAGNSADYEHNDHGTHMTSLAAGWTFGTARNAAVHPIQILDKNGEGSTASFLCGVDKVLQDTIAYNAANVNPDAHRRDAFKIEKKFKAVVSLSLGINGRSDVLDNAVRAMTDAGVTVVIAAGDNNDNACFYSPYAHSAITVGALKDNAMGVNDKTDTSNYGECIDIWAPGEDIYGASNQGEYEKVMKSGTSVAAAFLAGVSSQFFEKVLTTEHEDLAVMTAMVKEKIMYKAENNVLGFLDFASPNKMVQTTVSKCESNLHCDDGLNCLLDGSCVTPGSYN